MLVHLHGFPFTSSTTAARVNSGIAGADNHDGVFPPPPLPSDRTPRETCGTKLNAYRKECCCIGQANHSRQQSLHGMPVQQDHMSLQNIPSSAREKLHQTFDKSHLTVHNMTARHSVLSWTRVIRVPTLSHDATCRPTRTNLDPPNEKPKAQSSRIGGVHHTTTFTRTIFTCPRLYAQCSAFLFRRSLASGLAPC